MPLPPSIAALVAGWRAEPVTHGESGARVTRFTSPRGDSIRFLKRVAVDPEQLGEDLAGERARLAWLRQRGHSVPAALAYEIADGIEHLLLTAIEGRDAAQPWPPRQIPGVVDALAEGLRRLHATSIDGCPFRHDRADRLRRAALRLTHGAVDGEASATKLAGLHADAETLPPEELVVTHGDYCLPNVLLVADDASAMPGFSGYVDCARSGLADRYQDLALVARSLVRNLGTGWESRFFAAYGLEEVDDRRLRFYALLDDFY